MKMLTELQGLFVALLQLLCHVRDITWAFSSYDDVYPV